MIQTVRVETSSIRLRRGNDKRLQGRAWQGAKEMALLVYPKELNRVNLVVAKKLTKAERNTNCYPSPPRGGGRWGKDNQGSFCATLRLVLYVREV